MPAEILQDAGFRTFAIWRNGWIRPAFGFSQDFEVYHSPRASPVPASVRRDRAPGTSPAPLDIGGEAVLRFAAGQIGQGPSASSASAINRA